MYVKVASTVPRTGQPRWFSYLLQSPSLILFLMQLNLKQMQISSKEKEAFARTQLSLYLIMTLRAIIYGWLAKGQDMCPARGEHRRKPIVLC